MSDTKRLLELALKGLEAERTRINDEIAEIESQLKRTGSSLSRRGRPQVAAASSKASNTGAKAPRKRRKLSAAARKKLSDIAKRRWIASKKAGKSTL